MSERRRTTVEAFHIQHSFNLLCLLFPFYGAATELQHRLEWMHVLADILPIPIKGPCLDWSLRDKSSFCSSTKTHSCPLPPFQGGSGQGRQLLQVFPYPHSFHAQAWQLPTDESDSFDADTREKWWVQLFGLLTIILRFQLNADKNLPRVMGMNVFGFLWSSSGTGWSDRVRHFPINRLVHCRHHCCDVVRIWEGGSRSIYLSRRSEVNDLPSPPPKSRTCKDWR